MTVEGGPNDSGIFCREDRVGDEGVMIVALEDSIT